MRLRLSDEAITFFDQSIARSHGTFAYKGRAVAYARKGDEEKSAADWAAALKLNPDGESIFAEYGVAF